MPPAALGGIAGSRIGYRAHRNPITELRCEGSAPDSTAKTPAAAPSMTLPPREKAPGRLNVPLVSSAIPVVPGPPTQLESAPKFAGQFVQATERSPQSATHSSTLPIMSNAPQRDLQLEREPVSTRAPVVAHVVAWSSAAPGSGVPAAAPCHSSFVISRFPDRRHAWFAWNQLMHRD